MLKSAQHLLAHGFAVHWLHHNSKRPKGKEWSAKPVHSQETLTASYARGDNVGVRTGRPSRIEGLYLHIIDFDIRSPEHEAAALKKFAELLPEINLADLPRVRSGSGGASFHAYILTDRAYPSKKFAHSTTFQRVWDNALTREVKKWDWELHLLGTGAQAVVPPSIHDKTLKPYRWIKEFDWDMLALGLVDTVPAEALERLIGQEENENTDADRAKPLNMTTAEVSAILSDLPYEDWFEDRDGWYRVGMALHHQYEGDAEGFELWCEFSKRSPKFDLRDSKRVWKSFKNRTDKPFRVASLKSAATDARIMREIDEIESDFDEIELSAATPSKGVEVEDEDGFEEVEDSDEDGDDAPPTKTRKAVVADGDDDGAPGWVKRLNRRHAIARLSSKTVILDFHPDGRVTYGSAADLHIYYENKRVATESGSEPISKAWLRHKYRREYDYGIVFAPNRETPGYYNHWQGFSVEASAKANPAEGCALFLQHLFEIACNSNQEHYRYMLGWMAHMIQKPEEKPGVAIVFKGRKRIGKDTVFEYLGELIKNHYITVASQEQLTGKFNQHQEKVLLLHMQEGFWAGNKQAEGMLKYQITSTSVMIEPKGVNAFPVPSVLRIFISSNERWVVPATEDEGRFFISEVSDKRRNDHAYFAALRKEMKGDGPSSLLAFLQQYDISDFQVRAVPDTEALADQKIAGLKNVERWWLDILQRGEIDGIQNQLDGVRGEVWERGAVEITTKDLRSNYTSWLRGRRYDGEEVSEADFGRRLLVLLPTIDRKQRRRDGVRVPIYILPNLAKCRLGFEDFMGSKLDWPDFDDNDSLDEYDL